jgi:hypothetical protein
MIRASSLVLVAACAFGFAAADVRIANQNVDRGLTRVVFFDPGFDTTKSSVVLSEVFVEYGAPVWKGEYDAVVAKLAAGTRLRLGKDTWTTLETWNDLDFGGTTLGAGRWGLLLEKGEGDAWSLVAIDAAELFRRRMEANWPMELKGGVSIPLALERIEEVADEFEIKLVPAADVAKSKAITLELAFGPRKATVRFTVLGIP